MFAELQAATEKSLNSALPPPFVFDKEVAREFLKGVIVSRLKQEAARGATQCVLDDILRTDGTTTDLNGITGSRWILSVIDWILTCRQIVLTLSQTEKNVFEPARATIAKEIVDFIRNEWEAYDPTVASAVRVNERGYYRLIFDWSKEAPVSAEGKRQRERMIEFLSDDPDAHKRAKTENDKE